MDPQAIFENYRQAVVEHYFDLRGRVGRAQFWYFVLANFILCLGAAILGAILSLPLSELYNLALLFPFAGMGARRLQDTGRDGKLIWAFLILGFVAQVVELLAGASYATFGGWSLIFIGPQLFLIKLAFLVLCVVLIYFWCQPGEADDNVYGPPPPRFNPSRPVSPPA